MLSHHSWIFFNSKLIHIICALMTFVVALSSWLCGCTDISYSIKMVFVSCECLAFFTHHNLWVIWCHLRLFISVNRLPQLLHTKCFWMQILWWFLRLCDREKCWPHWSHPKGFSSVWIIWCLLRVAIWEKCCPHLSHP